MRRRQGRVRRRILTAPSVLPTGRPGVPRLAASQLGRSQLTNRLERICRNKCQMKSDIRDPTALSLSVRPSVTGGGGVNASLLGDVQHTPQARSSLKCF